jgi:hypothetical protein
MIYFKDRNIPTNTESSLTDKALPIKHFVVFAPTISRCMFPGRGEQIEPSSSGEALRFGEIDLRIYLKCIRISCDVLYRE